MTSVGFLTHAASGLHDPGAGHPERPGRWEAVRTRLEESGLLTALDGVEPRRATEEELSRVHTEAHVRRVREVCARAPAALDGDTCVSPDSWEAALRGAGAALEACESVARGTWRRAFSLARPPGHHAEADRAMGFCLFNNVALGAEALVREHGLERVAIVDFDVHHGNGTQHLFEEDPRVFYASLHQWPLYPGTGAASERGRGEGEGATLNVPLAAGSGDAEWSAALEESVLPALEAFRPEVLLLSAGFDAHRFDPLAGCELTTEGYRGLTRGLLSLAETTAGGRVVSFLEGGYHLGALADSVEVHVGELLGG